EARKVWMNQFSGTSIFQLLTGQEATLEERLLHVQALCKVAYFSQVKQLDNQTLAKAYATVTYLRTLAGQLGGAEAHDDISRYSIALFYDTLNTLQFSPLKEAQHEQGPLCTRLLADRPSLGS